MNLISAASIFTKDVSKLGIGEVVQVSVVIMAIVLAVVLIFGIKTYVHWRRRTVSTNTHARREELAPDPVDGDEKAPAPVSSRSEARTTFGQMRGTAAVRHFLD